MISHSRDQCFRGTQLYRTLEYWKPLGDIVLLGFRKPVQSNKTVSSYNMILTDVVCGAVCSWLFETPIPQPINENQFFYETFPSHIKFNVMSVDCQHTLWKVLLQKMATNTLNF